MRFSCEQSCMVLTTIHEHLLVLYQPYMKIGSVCDNRMYVHVVWLPYMFMWSGHHVCSCGLVTIYVHVVTTKCQRMSTNSIHPHQFYPSSPILSVLTNSIHPHQFYPSSPILSVLTNSIRPHQFYPCSPILSFPSIDKIVYVLSSCSLMNAFKAQQEMLALLLAASDWVTVGRWALVGHWWDFGRAFVGHWWVIGGGIGRTLVEHS